jgi:hypothetical protein
MATTTSVDDERRAALLRALQHTGVDADISHELYADDAVLEFPQSGERFEGLRNFREWRDLYPDPVRLEVRRLTGSGDLWVAECAISYDGGPWKPAVSILELADGKVVHERIYSMEPWPAPEWRARWRAAP